jgi:hypothetical protein
MYIFAACILQDLPSHPKRQAKRKVTQDQNKKEDSN